MRGKMILYDCGEARASPSSALSQLGIRKENDGDSDDFGFSAG